MDYAPSDPPPFFIDGKALSSTSIEISWRTKVTGDKLDIIPGEYTVEYVNKYFYLDNFNIYLVQFSRSILSV